VALGAGLLGLGLFRRLGLAALVGAGRRTAAIGAGRAGLFRHILRDQVMGRRGVRQYDLEPSLVAGALLRWRTNDLAARNGLVQIVRHGDVLAERAMAENAESGV
jgi:hypothetical protein